MPSVAVCDSSVALPSCLCCYARLSDRDPLRAMITDGYSLLHVAQLGPCNQYVSAVERIRRDNSKGDSLDHTEGDSSVVTPNDRDSVVMPISSVRSSGDSVDDTLDEQGTSFPRGRLMVPSLCT